MFSSHRIGVLWGGLMVLAAVAGPALAADSPGYQSQPRTTQQYPLLTRMQAALEAPVHTSTQVPMVARAQTHAATPTPAPVQDATSAPLPPTTAVTAAATGDNNQALLTATQGQTDEPCVFDGQCFCGPPGRVWFRGEYAVYWTNGSSLPPLVTTGPQNTGLNATNDPAGSLGRTDTTVLFGDNTVNYQVRSGFRIETGLWLDDCHTWGVQFDYLDLGPQNTHYSVSSDANGNPVIARPYYDVLNPHDTSNPYEWRQLVSYPGTLSGTVTVDNDDSFNTAGVSLRKNCICSSCCDCCGTSKRLDLIVGYRYYGLADTLTIRENLLSLSGATAGTRIQVTDSFNAHNQFHGAELGLAADLYRGRFTLGMTLKAALGNTHQTVNINGQTINTNSAGQQVVQSGGVYAVRSNMGTYSQDQFTVIPQISLEAGYMVTCNLRAFVGYNLIYWATIQRAGSAVDLNIDPRNIPGGLEDPATHFPEFQFCGSSFWAQGANVGLEYRY